MKFVHQFGQFQFIYILLFQKINLLQMGHTCASYLLNVMLRKMLFCFT